MPINHQRHHLVADNVVRNSPLHQEAIRRRLYNVDRGTNGKYLAETTEDFTDISKNYPTHNGSHPVYDKVVEAEINNINTNNLSSLSDTQIKNLIEDIEDAVEAIILGWKPTRLN